MQIKSLVFCLLIPVLTFSQKRTLNYDLSLGGYVSQEKRLPFWSVTNQNGIVPESNGGLLKFGLFSDFNPRHKIQFAYGASAAGLLSESDSRILLDELYISSKWEKIRLDLGMIHPEEEYNGISSTNGNFVRSGNSRTFPGYNLRSDYINIPATQGIIAFRFNGGDYMMLDNCYVKDIRLHNKSLFIKITPHHRWEIIAGLEHWAQWAGTHPTLGKQPASFSDYLRVAFARGGGAGSTTSDSINALGNHLGREHLRINYLADNYILSFYHDIPFEDGSGTDFRSFPDGTYCLYYGSKNPQQWISDMIYEFYYTKYQSGSRHDRPATPEEIANQDPNNYFYGRKILGGCDNYFNNGEYNNGWTLYGRVIGSPFMTPGLNGNIINIINNRIIGHHVGVKGMAWKTTPYKLLLSYTKNYGTYGNKFNKDQFSGALEVMLPFRNLPFTIETGLYCDLGKLFKDNFGFTIKFNRKGELIK